MKMCHLIARIGRNSIRLLPAGVILAFTTACGGSKVASDVRPREAAPEAISVNGELAERLAGNFNRMETSLYQPAAVFWSEEESGGWPGDKEGRTILALTLLQRATGRKALYLDSLMARLPGALNEKGYLGSIFEEADEQQLSGHGWLLRGLCEYHAMTDDSISLRLGAKIVDGLYMPVKERLASYPIVPEARIAGKGDMSGSLQNVADGWRLSSDIGCLFIGMEGLIHYYTLCPTPEVKSMIDDMISLFMRIDLKGIKAQTHASLTALRGVMRYMDFTDDWSLLTEVEARWKLYKDYGMTENFENFNWFDRFDTWTEPCAIVDSFMLAVQLWRATGNPEYLDTADEIYYNALGHTQRSNGGFGCDKPVGPAFDDISIHADEAHWCCTMRGGEGLSKVAQYSYFIKNDTVMIPFFRDSEFTLPDLDMKIIQTSDYPFGDEVGVRVSGKEAKGLAIGIRLPRHIASYALTIDGEPVATSDASEFVYVDAAKLQGSGLKIKYTLSTDTLAGASGRNKIMHGPLVMGMDTDSTVLSPLYHLMNPGVSLGNGYKKKVLFPSSEK